MQRFFILAVAALLVCIQPAAAQAQRITENDDRERLRLEFNRSPASAIQLLERRGFSQIKILDRDLLAMRLEACRDNDRFQFSLRLDGRIFNSRNVGACELIFIEDDEVRRIARQQGLRRVTIERRDQGFRVTGCVRSQERVVLRLANDGAVEARRRLGACERFLTIEQVAAKLVDEGYTELNYDEDQRRAPYRLDACERRARLALEVSATGEIQQRRVIGRCLDPIDSRQVPQILAQAGYDRIELLDDTPPIFIAEACKDDARVELIVGIRGRILQETGVGQCRTSVTAQVLKTQVEREGFYNIDVDRAQSGRGFQVSACYANQSYRLKYNAFGELLDQSRRSDCRQMNYAELSAIAKAREVGEPLMVLDGCRDGSGVIARLDRKGVYTEQIISNGRCR
ncbi:MAG: hypothetical protein AAF940_09860 [Pseudomonadota bacterium]